MTTALASSRPLYYQHSGQFPLSSLIFTLGAGLMGAAVLAAAYSYLILYIPIGGYISFLLTFGLAIALGWLLARAMRWANVRNKIIVTAMAVVIGLFAVYASWVVWLYAMLQRAGVVVSVLDIIAYPAASWELILALNDEGAWSLSNFTPTGIVLWLIWLAEAVIIVGGTILFARRALADPFCEECSRWTTRTDAVARTATGDADQLVQSLERHDMGHFETLGPRDEEQPVWLRADLHTCPTCRKFNTLSVSACAIKVDGKGNTSVEAKEFVRQLIISPEEAQYVRELDTRFAEAREGAKVAVESSESSESSDAPA